MKKTLLLLLCTITCYAATAQKATFGIRSGYTSAYLHEQYNSNTGNTSSLNNVDLGVYAEFKQDEISFQPGIIFDLKGGTGGGSFVNTGTSIINTFSDMTLYYLEIPLNLMINFKLKPGKIFLGAGPYVAFAMAGRVHDYTTTYNQNGNVVSQNTTSTPITFGSAPNELKQFDYGFGFIGGFRLKKGWEVSAGSSLGLANLLNYSNLTAHNQIARLSLGYFFK